ncbi:YuzF family protein [Halalkalibacter lacteus]|uniref:YuzF family protein n=1 Tax=Halalkalibacter lacteus TaxID=3090663 RepID=UPI002FC8CD86
MNQQTPSFVSQIDPYVYQTLQEITGTMVVIQTTRGTVSGRLKTVMPDHIVVESGGSPFFIRTQQIVWVIPKG